MAAALRVFNPINCMKPENTTAQAAVSRIRSTKPSTPLAMVIPKGSAISTMTDAIAALFNASAKRRPNTMAVLGTGAARSLSKYPPSMSSTR